METDVREVLERIMRLQSSLDASCEDHDLLGIVTRVDEIRRVYEDHSDAMLEAEARGTVRSGFTMGLQTHLENLVSSTRVLAQRLSKGQA